MPGLDAVLAPTADRRPDRPLWHSRLEAPPACLGPGPALISSSCGGRPGMAPAASSRWGARRTGTRRPEGVQGRIPPASVLPEFW
jgi:hypothetical protein